MKERFHVCVVAGSPPARRTLADAQRAETIAERVAGILAASIAMENQSSTGVPTTHGRIEDSARQAGIAGAAEPPSEHPTGALVQHDGEKAPPPTDWEIGDVADPDLIGARGDAGPHAVGMLAVEAMQPRIGAIDLHDPRAQAGRAPPARAHARAPAPGVGGSRAAVAPSPPPAFRGASRRARPSATATA